jgi:nucleotidyltransferase/DNA polymerase involved in DNA repair
MILTHTHSITEYCNTHNINADACVEHLRHAIFSDTGLTVSAGIAPNMVCLALDLPQKFTNSSVDARKDMLGQGYFYLFTALFD